MKLITVIAVVGLLPALNPVYAATNNKVVKSDNAVKTESAVKSDGYTWRFDATNSKLAFVGSYEETPVEGLFKTFSGTVHLDSKLNASFNVQVNVNSIDTEYAERDDTLRSTEWFDTKQFPQATFVSKACVLKAALQASCPGTLTIKGVARPSNLLMTYQAKNQTITGSAKLNRRDFKVGSGEWDEAGVIGQEIEVRFSLQLKAAK